MKKITTIILCLLSTTSFLVAQEYIDTSFGTNGISDLIITTTSFDDAELHGFGVTDAGKIINLAVNEEDTTIIVQYNSDGTLDLNFGTNGSLELVDFYGVSLVTDTSNNIYICGISVTHGRLSVLALNSSGNLLTSFGTNGITAVSGLDVSLGYVIKIDTANNIIVSGVELGVTNKLITASFDTNGNINTSFGTDGTLSVDISDVVTDEEIEVNNISLFADNSILVTGDVYTPEDATPTGNPEYNEFAIKINASGSLDTTFGTNGVSIYYDITASEGNVYASYILSNNKILLSISGHDDAFEEVNGLLRLNTDGAIDTTFGTNGLLTLVNNEYEIDELFKTSLDSDILVFGNDDTNRSVIKINENGVIDTSFAENGILPITFPGIATTDLISNAIELPNNKILVSGFLEDEDGFLMARYFTEDQLSIDDVTQTSTSIFPNPVKNELTLVSNKTIDTVEIYQIDGKLVLMQSIANLESNTLDVSSLKSGIYIIKVESGNTKENIKFIKL